MNNKFNYVLIDGSNLYHRSYSLFKPNGKNIINHLLETISKIQNDFCNNESLLYFIFDNSQSQINIRKQIDPLYKSNREKIDKEIYKYHNIFIELLKVKNDNYRILMAGTLEADDLVKPLIKYIESLEKNYRLISLNIIPEFSVVEEFTVTLNKMLVNSMLSNLLMQSSEYLKQYSPQSNESATPDLNQL
jgi:5'-3' exonuclease